MRLTLAVTLHIFVKFNITILVYADKSAYYEKSFFKIQPGSKIFKQSTQTNKKELNIDIGKTLED